jgi:hypothetical protein
MRRLTARLSFKLKLLRAVPHGLLGHPNESEGASTRNQELFAAGWLMK